MAYFADLFADLKSFPSAIKLFYVGDIFFGLATSVYSTLFNLHLLQAGFTANHIGTLQSVGAAVTALVAVPIGLMGDRLGRRWLYVVGALGFAIPYAVMPFLHNFAAIVATYALGLLFNTAMFVVESPLVAEEIGPEKRATVFSLMIVNVTVWTTLGVQVAGLLSAWLPAGPASHYQYPLVVAGALGMLCGVMRWITPFRRVRPARTAVSVRPSGTALALGAISVVSGAAFSLSMSFTNVVLDLRFHMSAGRIATVLTVAGVLGWASSWVVPWFGRKLGDQRSYAVVVGLLGVVFVFLGVATAAVPFVAGLWLRNMLNTMQMALWSAFSMSVVAPGERATANSWAIIGRNVGVAVASKGYGAAIAAGHFGLAYGVAAALAGVTAALTLLAVRRPGRQLTGQRIARP